MEADDDEEEAEEAREREEAAEAVVSVEMARLKGNGLTWGDMEEELMECSEGMAVDEMWMSLWPFTGAADMTYG